MRKIVLILIGVSLTAMVSAQETVKDVDGNEYKTVKIGSQTWMAENLKVTKTPDGKAIKQYCYDNDKKNCKKYGGLYTWEVAKEICPSGWHLPDDYEWTTLTDNFSDIRQAGVALKENGSSNFDALLAGYYRFEPVGYDLDGVAGFYWSSIQYDNKYAINRNFSKKFDFVSNNNGNKKYGYSVRCIKD